MVNAGLRLDPFLRQRGSAIALNAFGVRPVQRQAWEELGSHAAAAAAVVVAAAATCTGGLRFPQLPKQWCVLPYVLKAVIRQDVSGMEPIVNGERACVYVADRVDETHHATGTTQVQP